MTRYAFRSILNRHPNRCLANCWNISIVACGAHAHLRLSGEHSNRRSMVTFSFSLNAEALIRMALFFSSFFCSYRRFAISRRAILKGGKKINHMLEKLIGAKEMHVILGFKTIFSPH